MPEAWTGELIGKMHNARVTLDDMAKEMCCTKAYVCAILHSRRKPEGIEKRCAEAFERILQRREAG